MLKEPAIGHQVDVGQHRFAEIADGDEKLAEKGLRNVLRGHRADELPAHEIGEIGPRQGLLDAAQGLRCQRLAFLLLCSQGGARVGSALDLLVAFALGIRELAHDPVNLGKIGRGVVPLGKGRRCLALVGDEGIVAKQEARLADRGFGLGMSFGFINEEKVVVLQFEKLARHRRDERLETIRRGPDVLVATVDGLQGRQAKMSDSAALRALLKPLDVVEKQSLLARAPFRYIRWRRHLSVGSLRGASPCLKSGGAATAFMAGRFMPWPGRPSPPPDGR